MTMDRPLNIDLAKLVHETIPDLKKFVSELHNFQNPTLLESFICAEKECMTSIMQWEQFQKKAKILFTKL